MGKDASLGKEAVLAASGRAGEKSDFFSILAAWHLSLISNLGTLVQLQQRGVHSKEVKA